MRKHKHQIILPMLGIWLFPSPSQAVELLSDPTFSAGFVFELPDRDEEYDVSGLRATHEGMQPHALSSDSDNVPDFVVGTNKIGGQTYSPPWTIGGLDSVATPYQASRDINPATGFPASGAGNCPSGATGTCLWQGSVPVPILPEAISAGGFNDSNDDQPGDGKWQIISVEAGRGYAARSFDLRMRYNGILEYKARAAQNYFGHCSLPPGTAGTHPVDPRCAAYQAAAPFFQNESDPLFFQTQLPSGGPIGQSWPHYYLGQEFAGNTRLADISTLSFSGKIRLKRNGVLDNTKGYQTCQSLIDAGAYPDSPARSASGIWDQYANGGAGKWVNCIGQGAGLFDVTFVVRDFRNGGSFWLRALDSAIGARDVQNTGSGNRTSSNCFLPQANFGQSLQDTSNWTSCNDGCDGAGSGAHVGSSMCWVVLPGYVFFNGNTHASPTLMLNDDPVPNAEDSGMLPFTMNLYDVNGVAGMKGWLDYAVKKAHLNACINSGKLPAGAPMGSTCSGVSLSSNPDDYRLENVGIGFEIGNPIDMELQLKDLSLQATYKTADKYTTTNAAQVVNSIAK